MFRLKKWADVLFLQLRQQQKEDRTFPRCVEILQCLTSDGQPACWWFSNINDFTLVEAFNRFRNPVDGHVSCRAAHDEKVVFIEISSEVWGRLGSAAQTHSFSFHHRQDRTLQDHRTTWTTCVWYLCFDKLVFMKMSCCLDPNIPVTVMLTLSLFLSLPSSHQYSPLSCE